MRNTKEDKEAVLTPQGIESDRVSAPSYEDDEAVDRALVLAVAHALRDHKQSGNPVAGWRDGRVVIVQPEDIPLLDEV